MLITCNKILICKHKKVIDDNLTICNYHDRNWALLACPHSRLVNVLKTDTPGELMTSGGHIYKGEKAILIDRAEKGEMI